MPLVKVDFAFYNYSLEITFYNILVAHGKPNFHAVLFVLIYSL